MRRMTVKVRLSTMASAIAMSACLGAIGAPAYADEAAAKKWIDTEFQPSTLSKDEQLKEMQWFISAAKPFVANVDARTCDRRTDSQPPFTGRANHSAGARGIDGCRTGRG